MGFSLSAAIFALLQLQSEPIGELAKDEFCNLLSGFGYKASLSNDQKSLSLSDGSQSLEVWLGMHGGGEIREIFVGSASCRIEFDLPRTLENKKLVDWQVREKLTKFRMHSFLGGRVILESHVFHYSNKLVEIRANLKALFDASRKLKHEIARLGGKPSESLNQIGKAPLDLYAKLELIEQEDLDYLRVQLGWGKRIAHDIMRGWCTGAKLMGLPIYFTGMIGPRAGFFVACLGSPDANKLERWERTATPAAREGVTVQDGRVHIQNWIDTTGGLFVRDVVAKILEFTRRVKAMDLF